MLKFFFVFLFSGFLFAAPELPVYQGYVTDLTQTLSPTQRDTMVAYSTALANKTGIQVATLVVPELGMDIEGYANAVFTKWGIGNKQDQGVLFVLSLADRRMRYEVGYGAEAWLTDGKAGELLDANVLPLLQEGKVAEAIFSAHLAVIALADADLVTHSIGVVSSPQMTEVSPVFLLILFGVFVFLVIVTKGKILRWLFWLLLAVSSGRRGGGGGFGGFGGGRSGGGGASRGW